MTFTGALGSRPTFQAAIEVSSYKHHVSVLVSLGMLIAGCAGDSGKKPAQTPAPVDLRPVEDNAPYWCNTVPKSALSRVTGKTHEFVEDNHELGSETSSGECIVAHRGSVPLALEIWAGRDDSALSKLDDLDANREEWTTPLSGVVGIGSLRGPVMGTTRSFSLFGCGGRTTVIALNVSGPVRGRDRVKDLSAVMAIAQRRYSKFSHCKLGRPPKPSLAPTSSPSS